MNTSQALQEEVSSLVPFIASEDRSQSVSQLPEEPAENLRQLLNWTLEHLTFLISKGANAQIQHLHDSVGRSLFKYREDIESDVRRRTMPKTWSTRNTPFNP